MIIAMSKHGSNTTDKSFGCYSENSHPEFHASLSTFKSLSSLRKLGGPYVLQSNLYISLAVSPPSQAKATCIIGFDNLIDKIIFTQASLAHQSALRCFSSFEDLELTAGGYEGGIP
jgi:hypothetical protein